MYPLPHGTKRGIERVTKLKIKQKDFLTLVNLGCNGQMVMQINVDLLILSIRLLHAARFSISGASFSNTYPMTMRI